MLIEVDWKRELRLSIASGGAQAKLLCTQPVGSESAKECLWADKPNR